MSEVTAEMIERGRRGDPEETSRRRKMNIKLKHVRHSLTSSPGDAAGPFDSMVRLFAESARSAAPASALLTLGVGAVVDKGAAVAGAGLGGRLARDDRRPLLARRQISPFGQSRG